jgi:hypothetical protein
VSELVVYKVSIFGGDPGHLTSVRFDIRIAASSKEFAQKRAFDVAAAQFQFVIMDVPPPPLRLHKTFTEGAPRQLPNARDGEVVSIEMGRFG